MSPNPYPLFAVDEQKQPKELKKTIILLIRLYLRDKNQWTAQAVEAHINALLAHNDFKPEVAERCQFRRLAIHWKYLAWINDMEAIKVSNQPQPMQLAMLMLP